MNLALHPAATLDISIGGMTCASCVGRVEQALQKVPGVQSATVNLATESARIAFAPDAGMDARLRCAVRDAGYEPRAAAEAMAAQAASGWAGSAPVALGLLLSAPLIAPMLAAPSASIGCWRPGCSCCWPRRCSSGSARASTAPAGMP